MSNETASFENSITSTLVESLFGRAKYSQLYPGLLKDFQAKTLMEIIKNQFPEATDDFTKLENFVDDFYGLTFIIRAHIFDVFNL